MHQLKSRLVVKYCKAKSMMSSGHNGKRLLEQKSQLLCGLIARNRVSNSTVIELSTAKIERSHHGSDVVFVIR